MTEPSEFDKLAEQIRSELRVPKQNEVFRAAVEAGYLVAVADGEFDATERATLVKAVETLSTGLVLEWETEGLLDDCAARDKKEGTAKRAEAVGRELKELGQAEAGLLLAAVVARATKKVSKVEADMLTTIANAAKLTSAQVKAIVKKASFGE